MRNATTRTETLDSMVQDVVEALDDLAAWPEKKSTKDEALTEITLLKKYLQEADYPAAMDNAVVMDIAGDLLSHRFRDHKIEGLREAWTMIGNTLIKK